jgi:multimeric flavodoxin WrbA
MKPVNVLGICGSPRKGNSHFLLEKALEGCREVSPEEVTTRAYAMRGRKFEPCIACSHCEKHDGECVHKDDFSDLKALWLEADVILYSVPVYHMTMPGQLKCFIDRLGNSMFGTYRSELPAGSETIPKLLKVIGSIAQGMHIFSGQEHTITDLINHALVMQSVPVTADLWQSYIGAAGWTCNRPERDALERLAETEEIGAVAAVHASRILGRRAVEMAMIIRSGLMARRELLAGDPLYGPVLSRLEGAAADGRGVR